MILLIPIVLLLIGLADLPTGNYTMVRIVVFLMTAYYVTEAIRQVIRSVLQLLPFSP